MLSLKIVSRVAHPSPLRGGWPGEAGSGGEPRARDSPLDLPCRRAVFIVFQRDAHRGEFVADTVGLGPVFGGAGGRRGAMSQYLLSDSTLQPEHVAQYLTDLAIHAHKPSASHQKSLDR